MLFAFLYTANRRAADGAEPTAFVYVISATEAQVCMAARQQLGVLPLLLSRESYRQAVAVANGTYRRGYVHRIRQKLATTSARVLQECRSFRSGPKLRLWSNQALIETWSMYV